MNIFICIPVYNRIEYTLSCIESIYKQTYKSWKIIICDDGSTDGTYDVILLKYPKIKILRGTGYLWWAGSINYCVKKALELASENDFVFTLNNDTELLEDTLKILVDKACKYPRSIWSAVNLFYTDRSTIEPSAFLRKSKNGKFCKLHSIGEEIENKKGFIEVDLLSGKGVLIPVKAFTDAGLYDAKKLPHYHADTEFIHRAKKFGYKAFMSYDARLLSHHNLSGTGTWTSSPSLKYFLLSFFQIKSAHYLPSLYNYSRLIYGNRHIYRFIESLFFITGGFLKRYFRYKISRKI